MSQIQKKKDVESSSHHRRISPWHQSPTRSASKSNPHSGSGTTNFSVKNPSKKSTTEGVLLNSSKPEGCSKYIGPLPKPRALIQRSAPSHFSHEAPKLSHRCDPLTSGLLCGVHRKTRSCIEQPKALSSRFNLLLDCSDDAFSLSSLPIDTELGNSFCFSNEPSLSSEEVDSVSVEDLRGGIDISDARTVRDPGCFRNQGVSCQTLQESTSFSEPLSAFDLSKDVLNEEDLITTEGCHEDPYFVRDLPLSFSSLELHAAEGSPNLIESDTGNLKMVCLLNQQLPSSRIVVDAGASHSICVEEDFLEDNVDPLSPLASNESLFFERQGELVLNTEALRSSDEWIQCNNGTEASPKDRFLDLAAWSLSSEEDHMLGISRWGFSQGSSIGSSELPSKWEQEASASELQDSQSIKSSSMEQDSDHSFLSPDLLPGFQNAGMVCFTSFVDDALPPLHDQYSSDSRDQSSRLSEQSFGTESSSLTFEDPVMSRKPSSHCVGLFRNLSSTFEKGGEKVRRLPAAEERLPRFLTSKVGTNQEERALPKTTKIKTNKSASPSQGICTDNSQGKLTVLSKNKCESQLRKLGAPPRPVASLTKKLVPTTKDSKKKTVRSVSSAHQGRVLERAKEKVYTKSDSRGRHQPLTLADICARRTLSDSPDEADNASSSSTTNSIAQVYGSVIVENTNPIVFQTKDDGKTTKSKLENSTLTGTVVVDHEISGSDVESLVGMKEFDGLEGITGCSDALFKVLSSTSSYSNQDEDIDVLFSQTFAAGTLLSEEDAFIYMQDKMVEESWPTSDPSDCYASNSVKGTSPSSQLKHRICTEVVQSSTLSLERDGKSADAQPFLISLCPTEVEIGSRSSQEVVNHLKPHEKLGVLMPSQMHSTTSEKECQPFVGICSTCQDLLQNRDVHSIASISEGNSNLEGESVLNQHLISLQSDGNCEMSCSHQWNDFDVLPVEATDSSEIGSFVVSSSDIYKGEDSVNDSMENDILGPIVHCIGNEKEAFDDFGDDFFCMKTFDVYQTVKKDKAGVPWCTYSSKSEGKSCDVRHIKLTCLKNDSGSTDDGDKGGITMVTIYKNPLWWEEFDSVHNNSSGRESEGIYITRPSDRCCRAVATEYGGDIWNSDLELATENFRPSESVAHLEEVILLCTGISRCIPEGIFSSFLKLIDTSIHDKSTQESSKNRVSMATIKATNFIEDLTAVAIDSICQGQLNGCVAKDLSHEVLMIDRGQTSTVHLQSQMEKQEIEQGTSQSGTTIASYDTSHANDSGQITLRSVNEG